MPEPTLTCKGLLHKLFYTPENKIIPDEKRLKDKDCFICFSSGSLQHIGKVAYISGDTKYYAGGFMGILRPKAKDEVPQYIYFVLNTPFMRDYVRNDAAGANIKNLSNQIGKIKMGQSQNLWDSNSLDE